MSNNLKQKFFDFYQKEFANCDEFFIAYSGGLDSHVLLHLCAAIRQENASLKLTAIHINHNLSANAQKWDQHCEKICRDLKIKYIAKNIDVKKSLRQKNKQSLEALARELRYKVFAKILPENGVLLTAHHADDLAETVLLQLFRGAGPKGLAAISEKNSFANGILLRPLLQFTRAEILEYAILHDLQWIEDESNIDEKFERNYIRHKVMPMIKLHWQGVTKAISRSAFHCAESDELLKALADEDLALVKTSFKNALSITKLLTLNTARQKNVMRYWLHQLNLALPATTKMQQILKTILHCRSDRNPLVHWDKVEIRRFKDNIYALHELTKQDVNLVFDWDLKQPLNLPNDLGTLVAKFSTIPKKVQIKFRRGGEKCDSHSLKKIFQEQEVPVWLRNRIPLVYLDNKLMIVVGYYVSKNWNENCTIELQPEAG